MLIQIWGYDLAGEFMSPSPPQMYAYTHPVNRLKRRFTMTIVTFSSTTPPTSVPSRKMSKESARRTQSHCQISVCGDFDEFIAILHPM